MRKKQRFSSARTGLVAVLVAAGCCSLGVVACAANASRSPNASGTAERHAVTPRHETAVASRGQSGPVVQPAIRRMESADLRRAPTRANGVSVLAATNQDDPVLVRGRALFAKYCAICHGEKGDGAGKFAYLMNPRPRDFKQGDFKLATTQNQIPTEADLVRTIGRGIPGSAMPPWDHLPLADLKSLAAYVRHIFVEGTTEKLRTWVSEGTLKEAELPQALADRTAPGAPLVIPPEPIFDEIHWFRGRQLYLENCASCHGADGQPVAEAVKFDSAGYPVPPRSFVNGIFKGGSDGHQLYARIWKGIKGTPMPGSEGVYTGDETWDIIHYIQSLARAGAQERAQLKQGTFVAPNIGGPLPTGPDDSAWGQARPLYIALTPLWWTEDRVEGLVVRAVHNNDELAIRLSWLDPTRDERAVRQNEFRDGVAIQFSLSSDPPFYMGDSSEHGGVNIWFWKADRARDIAKGFQGVDSAFPDGVADMYPEQGKCPLGTRPERWTKAVLTTHNPRYITAWGAGNLVADPNMKMPVESLVAHGPGTLSGKPANIQMVGGKAVYERGVWSVQMQRPMRFTTPGHDGERVFKKGDYLPVSFAIWNGSAGDRDGKKNISIWQKLVIE